MTQKYQTQKIYAKFNNITLTHRFQYEYIGDGVSLAFLESKDIRFEFMFHQYINGVRV